MHLATTNTYCSLQNDQDLSWKQVYHPHRTTGQIRPPKASASLGVMQHDGIHCHQVSSARVGPGWETLCLELKNGSTILPSVPKEDPIGTSISLDMLGRPSSKYIMFKSSRHSGHNGIKLIQAPAANKVTRLFQLPHSSNLLNKGDTNMVMPTKEKPAYVLWYSITK